MDLKRYVDEVPPSPRLSMLDRLRRHWGLSVRSLPEMLGLRKACLGFRNVPDAPPLASH